jgi:D-alanyl-D-alanine carboxypeptidase
MLPAGRQPNELELLITNPKPLQAPVTAGASVATLDVRLNGTTLTTAELVTAEDIARANFFVRLLRTITSLFRNILS